MQPLGGMLHAYHSYNMVIRLNSALAISDISVIYDISSVKIRRLPGTSDALQSDKWRPFKSVKHKPSLFHALQRVDFETNIQENPQESLFFAEESIYHLQNWIKITVLLGVHIYTKIRKEMLLYVEIQYQHKTATCCYDMV